MRAVADKIQLNQIPERAPSSSERDVVVEIFPLAASGTARMRVFGERIGTAAPTARASHSLAGAAAAAGLAPHSSTAAAAEHLHLVADDFSGVALLALLVLPLASPQAALNVDLGALLQV